MGAIAPWRRNYENRSNKQPSQEEQIKQRKVKGRGKKVREKLHEI